MNQQANSTKSSAHQSSNDRWNDRWAQVRADANSVCDLDAADRAQKRANDAAAELLARRRVAVGLAPTVSATLDSLRGRRWSLLSSSNGDK